MVQTSGKVLVQWLVVAALFIALFGGGGAQDVVICNVKTSRLKLCRAAITGKNPPPPGRRCCSVMKQANLTCLCSYKSLLPAAGIDPKNALALPAKCSLTTPRQC